jgi:dihydrofolate reductase
MQEFMITIVAAVQKKDNAIGKNNALLFSIPADMRRFQQLTKGHPVIMGRKTYESLPDAYRPLPNRTNIVITGNPELSVPPDVIRASSLPEAIAEAKKKDEKIFIIGGGSIYSEAITGGLVDALELTVVDSDMEADVYFPSWEGFGSIAQSIDGVDEKTGLRYTFVTVYKNS